MQLTLNSPAAQVPQKAHTSDAGWDLFTPEDVELVEGQITMVDLRIKMAVPEGYFGLIVPRSSMAKRRILLANTVGIVDSGYRGSVQVALTYNPTIDMPMTTMVYHKERIAQLIVIPFNTSLCNVVDDLENTERGDGGFGSSGK